MNEFKDVFSEQPREARGVEHQIKTPRGCVVRNQRRRLPCLLWQVVKQEMGQMQQLGITEESQIPWQSLLVIVPKPSSSIKLYVDYRKLNEVASLDAFPINDRSMICLKK